MKRLLMLVVVIAAGFVPAHTQSKLAAVGGAGSRFTGQMIPFRANVVSPPLNVSPGTIDFSGLRPGQTYTAVADMNTEVTPSNAGETVSFSETTITGDPDATVLVTFVLPYRLSSYTSPGYMDVNYNALSASWGYAGAETHFFDPRNPETMPLGNDGAASIVLGCTLHIPETAQPDTYSGDAVIVVQYVGL
jgi:hypothetical protein